MQKKIEITQESSEKSVTDSPIRLIQKKGTDGIYLEWKNFSSREVRNYFLIFSEKNELQPNTKNILWKTNDISKTWVSMEEVFSGDTQEKDFSSQYLYICGTTYNEKKTSVILCSNAIFLDEKFCSDDEHLENGVCKKNEQTCTIENGQGMRIYHEDSWGACQAIGCDDGYVLENNICSWEKKVLSLDVINDILDIARDDDFFQQVSEFDLWPVLNIDTPASFRQFKVMLFRKTKEELEFILEGFIQIKKDKELFVNLQEWNIDEYMDYEIFLQESRNILGTYILTEKIADLLPDSWEIREEDGVFLKKVQANISSFSSGSMLGHVSLYIIFLASAVQIFFLSIRRYFKKGSKKYIQKVSILLKNQKSRKHVDYFSLSLGKIQESMKKNGYFSSFSFLRQFFATLSIKKYIVLLGGNGVGKTSFCEEMARAIHGKKYEHFFKKVLITDQMDTDREFLGFFDRINNAFIDPHGVTKFIMEAYTDAKNPYFLLLDESNMNDIERYFPQLLMIDKMIHKGETDFIKLGSISSSENTRSIMAKSQIIEDFGLLLEDEGGKTYNYGIRLPHNLHVICTANIDKCTEPLSGKIVDRTSVLTMKYMGENTDIAPKKDYSMNLFFHEKNFSVTSDERGFVTGLKNILNTQTNIFSKRNEYAFYSFLSMRKEGMDLNIGDILIQEILPKMYGEEGRKVLVNLRKFCLKQEEINLDTLIEKIDSMLEDDIVTFWKIT